MHYYQFNIKSYKADTTHLTNEEDLCYRRMLDMYYDTELPIPNDIPWVSRRLKVGLEIVETVLKEFFELIENAWRNKHCDDILTEYKGFLEKQKANGIKGGRPKKNPEKPTGFEIETQNNPNNKPLTTNHITKENLVKENTPEKFELESPKDNASLPAQLKDKRKTSLKGTRIPEDWVLRHDQVTWALNARPDMKEPDVYLLGEGFKDFWLSKSGSDAVKVDWNATWRNWVRNDKKFNGYKANGNGASKKFNLYETLAAELPELERAERRAAGIMDESTHDEVHDSLRSKVYQHGDY